MYGRNESRKQAENSGQERGETGREGRAAGGGHRVPERGVPRGAAGSGPLFARVEGAHGRGLRSWPRSSADALRQFVLRKRIGVRCAAGFCCVPQNLSRALVWINLRISCCLVGSPVTKSEIFCTKENNRQNIRLSLFSVVLARGAVRTIGRPQMVSRR